MPMSRLARISGLLVRVGITFLILMAILNQATDCFLFSRRVFYKDKEEYSDSIYRRRNVILTRQSISGGSPWGDRSSRHHDVRQASLKFKFRSLKVKLAELERLRDLDRVRLWEQLIGEEDRRDTLTVMNEENNQVRKKRSLFPEESVCPFRDTWEKIYQAYDNRGILVRVSQPSENDTDRHNKYQYFNTVSCTHSNTRASCPTCCTGINSSFSSRCETKRRYVTAKVHFPIPNTHNTWELTPRMWNISINGGCQCTLIL